MKWRTARLFMFPNKKGLLFETNINKYIHYIYETYFTLDGNPVLSDCSFFTMPLGHAAMILMEKLLGHNYLYPAAFGLGVLGVVMLLVGIISKKETSATFWGLFGGLFVWTGWIEFGYVYFANRFGVQPLIENGEGW